jgi:hypothetical protein
MRKRLSLLISIPGTIRDTFRQSKGFLEKSIFLVLFIPISFIILLHIIINPNTIIDRGKKK